MPRMDSPRARHETGARIHSVVPQARIMVASDGPDKRSTYSQDHILHRGARDRRAEVGCIQLGIEPRAELPRRTTGRDPTSASGGEASLDGLGGLAVAVRPGNKHRNMRHDKVTEAARHESPASTGLAYSG